MQGVWGASGPTKVRFRLGRNEPRRPLQEAATAAAAMRARDIGLGRSEANRSSCVRTLQMLRF